MSWQVTKFGELITKSQHGGTPSTKRDDFWRDGEIPWITGADFAGQKVANVRRHITPEAVRSSSTNLVKKGEFLLVTRTGVGKMAIATCDVAISQDITGIRFRDKISPEFMLYKLSSDAQRLVNLKQGTSISGIKQKDLSELEIYLPVELAEQSRIAEILTTVDEAIEATERLIAKYSRIKTGLMQDLLTRGIDKVGNIRDPKTHEFTTKNGFEVPEEWDVVDLRTIGKRGEHLRTGPFGSSLKISDWQMTGTPVVTIGSIGGTSIDERMLLYVSDQKASALERYKLIDGDILFSRVADVGRALVVAPSQEGWIMSSNFMRLRLEKSKVNPEYLRLNLSFNTKIKDQIRRASNSSGREVVNSLILNSVFFPLPKLDEQDRILRKLSSNDTVIDAMSNNWKKLTSIKTGLMQDLLSGRKRVNVADE